MEQPELFRKKRKNPVGLDIQLNEEQKEAKSVVLQHDVSIVTGKAGTGKSLLCAHTAMDL
ncbi:MAG: PhoH family protein, partial [Chlamydiia bacterium]|nr:PhoH family protein [Chlamydiia bacterium]